MIKKILSFKIRLLNSYLEGAHMDTRAQGQEAICQQHRPDKVTKAIKGQMKIQTFYSRALTASDLKKIKVILKVILHLENSWKSKGAENLK